jgi:hypothetical protein
MSGANLLAHRTRGRTGPVIRSVIGSSIGSTFGLAQLSISLCLLGAACDGPGNSGTSIVDPNLVRAVPWLNGAVPDLDGDGNAVVPSTAM